MSMKPRTVDLFGFNINTWSLNEAIKHFSNISRQKQSRVVFTPNVDHLVLMDLEEDFRDSYHQADYILADGMPLVWFSRLVGKPLPERVTGADLLPGLCAVAARKDLRIFLMGGALNVTPVAAKNLCQKFPGLQIVGIETPPVGFEQDEQWNKRLLTSINQASPDFLFVGLGAPKQEIWIARHKHELKTGLILGIGGAFDMEAGIFSRAPEWMQACGLEWVWRLSKDPKRLWRRYLVRDLRFLKILFREWKKQRLDCKLQS